MNTRKYLRIAGLIAVFVIVADQLSKVEVRSSIEVGERVHVLGPLDFTHTHNEGVAFGMASGGGIPVIVLSLVALVALGAFLAHSPRSRPIWIASGLIFGGAVGNLIDRVNQGHVTDFVLLPHWPAFNVADCAITVGVVVLAWCLVTQTETETGTEAETRIEET